ncbi:MAG: hypothetical protein KJ770_04840 [Actinobacteria bacterium]|nr:hypothetical protein [Actinomycetota bacterium]
MKTVDVISIYTKTGIIHLKYVNPVKKNELINGMSVLAMIAVPLCEYIGTGIIHLKYVNPVKRSVRLNGMKQRAKVVADQCGLIEIGTPLPSSVKTARVQMLQKMSPVTIAERVSLFQLVRKLNANKVVGSCQENVLTVASYLGTSHSIQYKKRLFLVTLSIVHTIALAN